MEGLVGLLFLVTLTCVVIVIVLAVQRNQELAGFNARLRELEREVARLRRRQGSAAPLEEEPPFAIPVDEVTNRTVVREPGAAESSRPPPHPVAHLQGPDAATLESWIGRQGFGWAAVVLLLFATAFFLKYAFDNRWIGELGRVALGILGGVALCVAGLRYHHRGWRLFSQMLTAGGVVLLYLATYAAFGYYHLLPRGPAGFFLILLVVETGALALRYEAPAIAIMAVIGALLNPVLLHSDRDQYHILFPYLFVLNAGVAALALFRHWRGLATLALLGTQGLFWFWYAEHYHPEKLWPALGMQVGIFALFLAHHLLVPVLSGRRVDVEELVRVPLNALFLTVAGYVLLDEDHHRWLGTLSLTMAAVYAALGWLLLRRHPEDPWHVLLVVAVSLAFLAMVFPLEADAAWIGLGWAVEGLALWWFGLRVRGDALRVLAVVLLALAVIRLVFVDTPWQGRPPFVPMFNKYAIPALLIAGCVAGAAIASRRLLAHPADLDRVARPDVFAKARLDARDLRLYDGNGEAVPYALRIRRAKDDQVELKVREFNRVTHPDRSAEVSLDLGDAPGEHNDIRVLMPGENVRRRLLLDGSNDDKKWSTLLDKADWMAFRAGDRKIEIHDFRYPVSRFRYVRVQVWPDRGLEDDKPVLQSVSVLRSIQVPAKNITLPANLGGREPVPADGAPGSAWFIDLGARVPCEKLSIDVRDKEFVREYRLEAAENGEPIRFLASGEWRRQRGQKAEPMVISFEEVKARRLRLVVTDYRNAPLTLDAVRYTAPARQVVFAPPAKPALPLRLYFGNPDADAPHHDFAATLPETLEPAPRRADLGEPTKNPDYQPPPLPWSERWPWLVYVVLSVASVVLLILLFLLGREAIAHHDRTQSAPGPST
jgi:hypothetical protein